LHITVRDPAEEDLEQGRGRVEYCVDPSCGREECDCDVDEAEVEEIGFVVVNTVLLLRIWDETSENAVYDGEIDGKWLPCEVPCLEI